MKSYHLACYNCKKVCDERESATLCPSCNAPIETYYDYEQIAQKLNVYALKTAPISALKYMAFYPIDNFKNIVSLDEGGTPLVHAKNLGESLGLHKLYIKNETLNPTGVFKDRGTMVEITKAKELGATAVCVASSGNMAASVAAYASAAKLPCYVLVPEGTPIGKLAQTLAFGARVMQVRSDYSHCALLAGKIAQHFGYYLAGDFTFRTEGQKSQGYEIIEQLFWKTPDYVVCPIGCGTNFHAIYKGMKEFYKLGLISSLPKLIGVQASGANSLAQAFRQKRKDFDVIEKPHTVASAIAVGNPLDGAKILADIYESGGLCLDIDDEYLLYAQLEQARLEGIFAEPAGVIAYAAVKKLAEKKFFKPDDTIVCIATGNGLKDPKAPLKILPEPATVEPNFDEIVNFIEHKLYALRESGREEKTKNIFAKPPQSVKKIENVLKAEFGIENTSNISKRVFEDVKEFFIKGKEISRSDLQYIIEEVLDQLSLKEKVLEIIDFSIHTTLKQKAEGEIWANAFGKEIHKKSQGVGPVDAALSALREALEEYDTLKVRLTDYEVGIDTRGVDASVEVKMTVADNKGNSVIARGTSPDIIVASLKAFEKGFNLLYAKNAE